MTKPSSLNGRLTKSAILLSQYEMHFLLQKVMKGQAVADCLAEHPDPRATELYEDLPDEVVEVCLTQTSFEDQVWKLFFDGTSRTGSRGKIIAGVGIVLISPTKLRDSSCILINRAMFQQCSEIQCSLDQDANR